MEDLTPKQISEIISSTTKLVFDQVPIPMSFVDKDGIMIVMNQAFSDFLGINVDDVIGKHITEVDPSVRLPIVLKTGKAEIGIPHTFHDGKKAIVHRIPLFHKNKLIGGVGIILIKNFEYVYNLIQENHFIKQYKNESIQKIDIFKSKYTFNDIITRSKSIHRCKKLALKYASTDFPVLITGESGVGKELFAHSIHHSSKRSNGPFIMVNCAAIPENLIESELFGYEKGAFTGADKKGKKGKFELANGGTIFLDEIEDLPLGLQAKLLRVLQEKEIEKIGSNKLIRVNIRVIAATNMNLQDKVTHSQFRQDLFYRLNVLHLEIPPLKTRKDDIVLLTKHFNSLLYQEYGLLKKYPEVILNKLKQYHWPGNIRELKNVIERSTISSDHNEIKITDLPSYLYNKNQETSIEKTQLNRKENILPLNETLATIEKEIILKTLKENMYNKAKTANKLGIPRMTLYRKLKLYENK